MLKKYKTERTAKGETKTVYSCTSLDIFTWEDGTNLTNFQIILNKDKKKTAVRFNGSNDVVSMIVDEKTRLPFRPVQSRLLKGTIENHKETIRGEFTDAKGDMPDKVFEFIQSCLN